MTTRIVSFEKQSHASQVVDLWKRVFGYAAPHNDPTLVIEKKIHVKDDLFFVAMRGEEVVGTIMAGYDGHRGWIYSMAVAPEERHKRIGQELLEYAESRLESLGCVKVNLQIMEGNESVRMFYDKQGYKEEKRISMGKILKTNI